MNNTDENKRLDGGAAFPCETYGIRNGKETTIPTNGMSLRDWFAGQALMGAVAHGTGGCTAEYLASDSYQIADAMIAARKEDAK
jgi:hypothetical protein